ncbi:hypothetical protein A2Z23_01130 [Candidatus Curtissbacteria bacterium RBG_16_39_7]|uniref:Fido domain-containing protein n=1 Tax=Candidatus Curtissbacteria bacterium RBG_16_39_7 TaxID=1797707 RepID=A0A1F5G2E1_9BACT|nr:MAG: hypothetical protein A2Z23_01130 [Candidatus Curtissbacteria bacterium RBG_16_39_7]
MPENLGENIHQKSNLLKTPEDAPKELWQREVDGMHKAIHFVQRKVRGVEEGGIDCDDIFNIHKMVMNDPLNPEKTGRLREVRVRVGLRIEGSMSQGVPPDTHFLSEFFNEFSSKLEEKTQNISIDSDAKEVLDLASWAHHRFIEIHPFEDGNGRTARLIVDFIFRKARLPYIKDWGAASREYQEVINKCFQQESSRPFRLFLAKKLFDRLVEVESQFSSRPSNAQSFLSYINGRINEVKDI